MARKARPSRATAEGGIAVELRAIAELRPDPKNARLHSEKQIGQIARSIEAFGFNVPVLVDGQGNIIAGHGRVLACQRLGRKQVPTIPLHNLNAAQIRAFKIADNKLTENAAWDERLLGESFKELAALNLDFQLEDTGFETSEIDLLIHGLDDAEDGPDAADDLPEPGPPVCALGDLWQLGPHRILCGDALETASYATLLGNNRAAAALVDPPYNVRVKGHVSGLGAVKHREFAMASGEMTSSQFTDFLSQALGHLAAHSKDGALHYVCMDWRHIKELTAAGDAIYTELKNVCVWVKHNAGMGSLYRSQHEFIFVFKNGKGSHRNNIQLGQNGRHRSNVWSYPGANAFKGTGKEDLLALHPTVKPVALVADAILDCTARGEIVLDSFLGSGTTILAAHRTGRVGYGIEIDPLYVDTAIRRWQTLSGLQAKHLASGRYFDEMVGETVGEVVDG